MGTSYWIAAKLRAETLVKSEILYRGYTQEELAAKLDCLPVGVEVLMANPWSLDRSFEIADALGIPLEVVPTNAIQGS